MDLVPANRLDTPISNRRTISAAIGSPPGFLTECDYRSALREATAPLHAEIDALFGAFDLASHDGLLRFLMAQAIGMRACQPQVMRFGQHCLDCSPPDYVQALTADLAALGVDIECLPRLELPQVADAGVFYVVAGSRMGTAVLRTRATAPTPGGPAHHGCSYFAAGEGMAIWRSFRKWLGAQGSHAAPGDTPADLPGMIAAATAAFQLFAAAARLANRTGR